MQARAWSHRLLLLGILLVPGPVYASPVVGERAPPLEVEPLSLHPIASSTNPLEALAGHVVYLDFWASWCPPCRIAFVELEALQRELGPRGLKIMAINVDEDRRDAMTFLEAHPVSYPVVRDNNFRSTALYKLGPLPVGYLLDRQGHILLVHHGFKAGDGARLKAVIEPQL